MKNILFISLLSFISVGFSQKKVSNFFQTNAQEVNIYTAGLDDLLIEDSNSDFVEVYLFAESYDEQIIKVENTNKTVNIKFNFEGTETREVIFRKFIIRRLQRANAIVRIPKNKMVYVFGENVDIVSKNIKNKLAIYIENGIVRLNTINANTSLKFYSGNVYASTKNTNLNLITKNGKIEIDGILQKSDYKKTLKYPDNQLNINTVKGNVFLSSIIIK